MKATQYFAIRLVRHGPIVPARLQWLDHEPGVPENKLDRGTRSVFPFVDIAGTVVPPEQLLERFHWRQGHWKHAEPVSEATYRHHFERMRQAERADPSNPVLSPRKRVDPAAVPLPSFAEENAR